MTELTEDRDPPPKGFANDSNIGSFYAQRIMQDLKSDPLNPHLRELLHFGFTPKRLPNGKIRLVGNGDYLRERRLRANKGSLFAN